MALDTEEKRWGMLRQASGVVPSVLINPSGSDFDTVAERLNVLGLYGGLTITIDATSITVSAIAGGASLSSLSYMVLSVSDIGVASIIKQGNDETTDGSTTLVIDITGLGVPVGTTLTIVITNYTTTPTVLSRAAVCYADAA